jgi:hypothetical protein
MSETSFFRDDFFFFDNFSPTFLVFFLAFGSLTGCSCVGDKKSSSADVVVLIFECF